MHTNETKYFIGIDLGSSFIKMSLYDFNNKKEIDSITYPKNEMEIISQKEGWAKDIDCIYISLDDGDTYKITSSR